MSQVEDRIRILGIAGSLREGSFNRLLVRLAAARAPEGVDFVEYDALRDVEPYDGDVEPDGFPPGAAAFALAARAADAVFIATPEYNASVPGQLKNALDWLSRPDVEPLVGGIQASAMYGRPVAVVSASDGQFGAVWARDELQKVLRTQGARVVDEPKVSIAAADRAFDDDGALLSDDATRRLDELVAALVATTRALRTARAAAAAAASASATPAAGANPTP